MKAEYSLAIANSKYDDSENPSLEFDFELMIEGNTTSGHAKVQLSNVHADLRSFFKKEK